MDPELTPDEIEALLAVYAINAVDDDERAAIERYLDGHPDAAAEVVELRRTAAMLAYTASEPVPDRVWEGIAPRLQPRTDDEVPSLAAHRARTLRGRLGVERATRRLVAVAAVVVLALAAAIGFAVARSGGHGGTSQAQLEQDAAAARLTPGARQAELGGGDGTTLASAVIRSDGRGYLTSHLPALPAGRTYQLWALHGDRRTSLGVLGSHPQIVAFEMAGRPDALAVTNEVAGGVKTSSRAPVAVGAVES